MLSTSRKFAVALAVAASSAGVVFGQATSQPAATAATGAASQAEQIYNAVTGSLVAVQYTWESELGRREIIGNGVVVSPDGLVVTSLSLFDLRIPDQQMKDFKLIVPVQGQEPEELDATFINRDERTNLAFIKAKEPRQWTPVKFDTAEAGIGQRVLSVGLLPKAAGYKSYLAQGNVSAHLRGEIPLVLVADGLATAGSPVFLEDGRAVGLVTGNTEGQVFLNDQRNPLSGLMNPPLFFIPASDFVFSLSDLPPAGEPQKLPWIGVPQLTGLKKDVAEYFGLKSQAAVEVGDVIPNTPAEKGGLKRGMIIVTMNGQPLERGDDPDEIAQILRKKLLRQKIGSTVTFGVKTAPDAKLQDVKVTMEERPKTPNTSKRFWAEDLGFAVRDTVFMDTYQRKLPADAKGVVVALIKPQSSAQTARLQNGDMVTEINGTAVTSADQFKQAYDELRKSKPKEAVVLVVLREGNNQVIRIEPPQ